MKNSIASLGISPAANRYLVEELSRVHRQNIELGDLAQKYVKQNGYLDNAGWEDVKNNYLKTHHLFTEKELDDPRLIAPPYLPHGIAVDPDKHKTWLRNQGIREGDPIVIDDVRKPGTKLTVYATKKSLE